MSQHIFKTQIFSFGRENVLQDKFKVEGVTPSTLDEFPKIILFNFHTLRLNFRLENSNNFDRKIVEKWKFQSDF